MMAEGAGRTALFQAIHDQPAIAAETAALLASSRRVFLVGTGTSSHAAIIGEHLLRLVGADAYALTNFDFVTYPRPIGSEDAVIAISHRGSKLYGKAAIARALEANAKVIGITGKGSPMQGAHVQLETAPAEKSSTHSMSYTANLVALGLIAARLGATSGVDVSELRDGLMRLPAMIQRGLENDEAVRAAADVLAAHGKTVLVGAGPNAATAREGALKVKESSYLVAEGFELETLLHGCLPAVSNGDLAVVIAACGPALDRTMAAIRALQLIGARLLVIADERVVNDLSFDSKLAAPVGIVAYDAVIEQLSPIPAVVPLQLLADYTATLRGTNADSFRADDPIYKAANDSYRL
jgi:glucosamine--fructose-6-phosphate aminotransferase (isomerizing)